MKNSLHQLFPKVAIVTDQMTAFGGADRVLLSVLKVLPDAEIFTILFNKEKYPNLPKKQIDTIHTSKLKKNKKIIALSNYRLLKIFIPYTYESFDLSGFDLVISLSAGPGKSVITKIGQPHMAMVTTPPRSLWDKELNVRASKFKKIYKTLSDKMNTDLRIWDYVISKRVDYWTSNSKYISKKIKKTYGVDSTVLYPGVSKEYFTKVEEKELAQIKKKYNLPKHFNLVVSRLYDYKKVDVAIRCSIEAKKNLVIIGDGPDLKYLQSISKGHEGLITFLNYIPDKDVIAIYHLADVFLFCGTEDFGLTPVESMACGTPVFAYKEGGLLETIQDHITGEFYTTEKELIKLILNFNEKDYNKNNLIKRAKEFSEEIFLDNFSNYIEYIYNNEKTTKENN